MLAGTMQEQKMTKQYKYKTAVIKLPNGKRKWVRGKTQKELDEKLAALNREIGLGIDISDETTVKDYADYWYRVTKEPYVTANTASLATSQLKKYVYPCIGAMKLRDVRAMHIRNVMSGCSGLGHGTQAKVLGMMRNIFNAAVDDNLILRSPVPTSLKAQGERTKETVPLTPEQEEELLRVTKGTPVGDTIYAMLQTGMRVGEMTGLMWSEVNFEENYIRIAAHAVSDFRTGKVTLVGGAKSESGVRRIPITPVFSAWLRERKRSASSVYVFPNSKGQLYSASNYRVVWATMNKKLSFHVHPHMLRHTYATKLFEAGLDIKEIQTIMGHASADITLSTYTHYRAEARQKSTEDKVRAALMG